ncbi:hypothetical protein M0R45_031530 [Rubus argutus]|uniref:Uncharacterized protein n=1 Tax=Rubus argutus TaxID=59490 RepID=A0AAW1WGN5_RUBAR
MVAATAAAPQLLRYSSTSGTNNRPANKDKKKKKKNSSILNTITGFNSQNDLEYLGKLLAGSIVGGAVINRAKD